MSQNLVVPNTVSKPLPVANVGHEIFEVVTSDGAPTCDVQGPE